ncbi:hypothetical protein GCM10022631_10550 [Deinococcus rubellus]|uniref:hypothetical protein n=1 Tax=Deinococcus rubellus TaxID=1889240 RepID=UPI0031ECD783
MTGNVDQLRVALELIQHELRGPKSPEGAAFLASLQVLFAVVDSTSEIQARAVLSVGLDALRVPVARLALPGEVAALHLQLEAAQAELKRERAVFLERERRGQAQP